MNTPVLVCEEYFEKNRGLLYEIRDLAMGGRRYAAEVMAGNDDEPFMLAMFCVIERNADAVLELLDNFELERFFTGKDKALGGKPVIPE